MQDSKRGVNLAVKLKCFAAEACQRELLQYKLSRDFWKKWYSEQKGSELQRDISPFFDSWATDTECKLMYSFAVSQKALYSGNCRIKRTKHKPQLTLRMFVYIQSRASVACYLNSLFSLRVSFEEKPGD